MIVRGLFVALCLVASVAQAQINPAAIAMIKPSPLGIVLTAGHWLIFSDNRKIYYIEVEGHGLTATEARDNGFRLAVEQALGTLISSESETKNGRLVRDEIISYAAGYVDRFDIVSTTVGNQSQVRMKVWVARSALADRLLNRSEATKQVDGSRASVRLDTLNQERVTGDRLLQQVLNDFPSRAFDIEFNRTDIVRQNRNAQMEITFRVRWNQDYLRSLWTALEATSLRGGTAVSRVGVNSGSWFGFGGHAQFDDLHKYNMVISAFVLSQPAVFLTVRGSGGQILYKECMQYQELDHQPRYNVTTERFVRVSRYEPYAYVDGSYRMRSTVQVPINSAVLNQISSIDLEMVTQRQCASR